MLRAIVLFLVLAALAAGAAWFADNPGALTLDWRGYRIETSFAVLVLGLLLVLGIVLVAYRLWRWVLGGPAVFWASRGEARKRRGYQALTRGLVAVAAGDAAEARKLARRTDALLDEPPLTLLLSAQAAQLDGDETAAKGYFSAMLERPETEFLGLRGLLVLARRAGDDVAALQLAERAFKLRPDTQWVLTELFALQAGARQWTAAERTLEHAAKRKVVSQAEAARRRAVVLFAQAQAAQAAGEVRRALDLARKAHRHDPKFAPATALTASLHLAAGERRKARKMLEDGWKQEPHPELAKAFAALEPDEQPDARLKRLHGVAALRPSPATSKLMLAEAALAADDFDLARKQLTELAEESPTARVCRLMAELAERGDDDAGAAREWLRRMTTAAPDPTWVCDSCGHQAATWTTHCPNCGNFDSFAWRRPPTAAPVLLMPQPPAQIAEEKPAETPPTPPPALLTPEPPEAAQTDGAIAAPPVPVDDKPLDEPIPTPDAMPVGDEAIADNGPRPKPADVEPIPPARRA